MGTSAPVTTPAWAPTPTVATAVGPVAVRRPSDLRVIARVKIPEGRVEGSYSCSCGVTELRVRGPAEVAIRCRHCGWKAWSEGQELVIAVRQRTAGSRIAPDQRPSKSLWRVAKLDDGTGHASVVCCRTHTTDPGRLVAVVGSRSPRAGDRFTCDDWVWRVVGEDSEVRQLYGESGLVAEPDSG